MNKIFISLDILKNHKKLLENKDAIYGKKLKLKI
jgi:hypothetical protein